MAHKKCYPDPTFTLRYPTAIHLQKHNYTCICCYTYRHLLSAVFTLQEWTLQGQPPGGLLGEEMVKGSRAGT